MVKNRSFSDDSRAIRRLARLSLQTQFESAISVIKSLESRKTQVSNNERTDTSRRVPARAAPFHAGIAAAAASRYETTPGPAFPWSRTPQCSVRSSADAQLSPANTAADPHSSPSPRMVLRMSLVESNPRIQPTTSRKAVDLLTLTLVRPGQGRSVPCSRLRATARENLRECFRREILKTR